MNFCLAVFVLWMMLAKRFPRWPGYLYVATFSREESQFISLTRRLRWWLLPCHLCIVEKMVMVVSLPRKIETKIIPFLQWLIYSYHIPNQTESESKEGG